MEIKKIFRKIRNGFWDKESNVIEGELADLLINRLIQEIEDYKLDFKLQLPSDNQKTGKLISAISNEGGGSILYGISDDREIIGLPDLNNTSERIFRIVRDKCKPIIYPVSIKIITTDNKEILAILIPQQKELVAYDNGYYKRFGDSTEKMNNQEIKQRKAILSKIFKNYSVIWESSADLTSNEVLGRERGLPKGGFREFYYSRDEDIKLDEILKKNFNLEVKEKSKHIMVIGPPLSGKSRIIYEWFKKEKNIDILIPRKELSDISFNLPHNSKVTNKKILYLDDINLYIKNKDFIPYFESIISLNDITILSTCRSGYEFENTTNLLLKEHQIDIENIFDFIKIEKIDTKLAKEIADKLNIDWKDIEFNGTIGSIILRLNEMRRRFNQELGMLSKTLLEILKYLYLTGLFIFTELYQITIIKQVSTLDQFEINFKSYELDKCIEELEKWEFVSRYDKGFLLIDSVYFESIIAPEMKIYIFDYKKLIELFNDDISILNLIALRLENISNYDLENKVNLLKEAISIYSTILNKVSKTKNRDYIESINKELGDIYFKLAKLIDTKENCKKSIDFYKKTLDFYSVDDYPHFYAMINFSLSNTYELLGTIEDYKENINKSIDYAKIAINIFKNVSNLYSYSLANIKLGNSYSLFAEVFYENVLDNYKLSIKAFEKALDYFNKEDFPEKYALICYSLGSVYSILTEIKDTEENFEKSRDYYLESIKIRTKETHPSEYSSTHYNLGILYNRYSQIGPISISKKTQAYVLKKAIKYFKESLKFRKKSSLPLAYAKTMVNISSTYFALSDKENQIENLEKSISHAKEAMEIYEKNDYPLQFALTNNNLANGYSSLAEMGLEPIKNLNLAIQIYEEILTINLEDSKILSKYDIMNNLGLSYFELAKHENKEKNCKKAIKYLEKALRFYQSLNIHIKIFVTRRNLIDVKEFCNS